ncbi:tRNA selenocysteine 1-associated protein 1-like isoform X1 [Syngnathus typhle]|uniref:tRNA selenocysteine 1-associated protein 1-like isoform X1 n=1 Tax=Syngnathus typhle TaxID=161592 RepID=UPI002A69E325|nr:tRNA selenocysteine 1-associated protein 1-like isoform X1 [Syngnathus typhle]
MFNRQTSLWMGDLDPYMDESFVKQAFTAMGESPLGVKIITHKLTGGSAGYCFVEMADEASVDRCVQKLNGKLVPGSNPPRKFKLNFATYGKRQEAGPEFSVFVGDLSSEVDDDQLHHVFKDFPSCKGAKVVTDQYGYSKGYGFVKFGDENEQKKAIEECQGIVLAGKALRLSLAVAKSQKTTTWVGSSQNYQTNYSQPPTNYFGNTNGGGQSYYSQWGSYDQYNNYNNGGYNSGYNNTSYNSGYNSGYTYNYGPYGYPPPSQMVPPPPTDLPPPSSDVTGDVQQSQEETGDGEDNTEVPFQECDVDQWNADFMQRSEEFFDALMDSHWEPLDSFDSAIPLLV